MTAEHIIAVTAVIGVFALAGIHSRLGHVIALLERWRPKL